MHGREGEEKKRGSVRHMWTEPTRASYSVVVDSTDVGDNNSSNSFYKDGRKISVGDCALFKPPQDSPPFIGIIRCLTSGKENKLSLGVNWLYRPAEVKLGKGILLEAAPNEIFYSFHKDEIPAASLLHRCKVAFLPKGADLPPGISSFVCRRVYDVTNERLWWLTDQDYIDERQEEVDQLLYKTRIEMHATIQPGARSPKPMNGPTSTSQLKPGSDSVQSSPSSFPSQVKGKKRERVDQGSDPVKRERFTKVDDGDSGHCKPEGAWKSEISKFTEKGGLVDSEGVEKLVNLILPERNEKKIDLVGRSILAGVVAATEKVDCLNRFVQLKGLPVFDEWLQEVHKGKIGDGSSPKDSDKSVEEFLLVLLRALDKLPINLQALQMCNIGKSVNHLRSHKNLEIQKKARSLVDTWKKRVEAEMLSPDLREKHEKKDVKAGSDQVHWPARSRVPEVSHGGNRPSGISSDVAMKSSVVQLSASKTAPVKLVQGDPMMKSPSVSPGSVKSVPSLASMGLNLKEGQFRSVGVGGASDLPVTAARDEKSSSPSQSHNNSQSCSSEHAKTFGKEDARSSTAGSATANKGVSGSLRHRKSVNGFPGAVISGVQKETGSARGSPSHRNPGSEKLPHPSLGCEKAVDVPMVEGNGHKLIVKISSRGRSPVQSASGGSGEDPSVVNSRASSPVLAEKHDQFDGNLKEKSNALGSNVASEVNAQLWPGNDFKDVLTGSDEGNGTPSILPKEGHSRTGEASRKLSEGTKVTSSSSGMEHKFGKVHEASYSSLNTFIENCVKYSEANASLSAVDDVGMNLLASVAAGEMSKTDVGSPNVSPQRTTSFAEHSCTASDSRVKPSQGVDVTRDQIQTCVAVDEQKKLGSLAGTSLTECPDGKPLSIPHEKQTAEYNRHSSSPNMDVEQTAEPCLESKVKSAAPSASVLDKAWNGGTTEQLEEKAGAKLTVDGTSNNKEELSSCASAEVSGVEFETKTIEGQSSRPSMEADGEKKNVNIPVKVELKASDMMRFESAVQVNLEVLQTSLSGKGTSSEKGEVKSEKTDETEGRSNSNDKVKTENKINTKSAISSHKDTSLQSSLKGTMIKEQHIGELVSCKASTAFVQESEQVKSRGSKLIGGEADESEECTSAPADTAPSSTLGSDGEAKVQFDLNEGFNVDDGKYGEPNNSRPPICSSVLLINPLPVPPSSVSASLPASITVAAAAKRPFVPPEDLLKNKGELGWKGSAATSAFRPAEPRKILETQASTTNSSLPDAVGVKPSRPLLDFDLNVPDERILEDLACRSSAQATGSAPGIANSRDVGRDDVTGFASVRSSGGLDFDLNMVDEPADVGSHLMSNGCRFDGQLQPLKSSSSRIVNVASSLRPDFDLNDGPLVDEAGAEPSSFGQHTKNSALSQPSVSGLRINNAELGSFPSWFPQGNLYPSVTIPSILPDRGEQSFPIIAPGGPPRMLAQTTGSSPFGSTDVYRGAVLTSSPAVPFTSTPFQYPVFPFGANFPIPSATFSGGSTTYVDTSSGGRLCFPAVHSQVLASTGAGPSHYPRPYVVSLTDSGNNGNAESSRRWGRQGLDLNAGPAGMDIEGRDETSSLASRQLSVASSQAALAEEQSRMYHLAGGGVSKRKEPDGGWDGYKQSSWQ